MVNASQDIHQQLSIQPSQRSPQVLRNNIQPQLHLLARVCFRTQEDTRTVATRARSIIDRIAARFKPGAKGQSSALDVLAAFWTVGADAVAPVEELS